MYGEVSSLLESLLSCLHRRFISFFRVLRLPRIVSVTLLVVHTTSKVLEILTAFHRRDDRSNSQCTPTDEAPKRAETGLGVLM